MRVEEIMTKDVSFCNPRTNAAAAAEIMWTKNCGSLPIIDDEGHVAGIVTDRDLFIALGTSNKRAGELRLGEFTHRALSLCAPRDDIRSALKTMAQRQLQRLPVVDKDGSLKGILSMDDIVLRVEEAGLSNEDVVDTMKAISEQHQVHRTAV